MEKVYLVKESTMRDYIFDSAVLECLRALGVDNWTGYDELHKELTEWAIEDGYKGDIEDYSELKDFYLDNHGFNLQSGHFVKLNERNDTYRKVLKIIMKYVTDVPFDVFENETDSEEEYSELWDTLNEIRSWLK